MFCLPIKKEVIFKVAHSGCCDIGKTSARGQEQERQPYCIQAVSVHFYQTLSVPAWLSATTDKSSEQSGENSWHMGNKAYRRVDESVTAKQHTQELRQHWTKSNQTAKKSGKQQGELSWSSSPPQYTNTLLSLKHQYPKHSEVFFLLGASSTNLSTSQIHSKVLWAVSRNLQQP